MTCVCVFLDITDVDAIKISIKLVIGGKAIIRRFNKTDLVQSIFAFIQNIIEETKLREFDVLSSFPSVSLLTKLNMTVEEASLSGSQVIMRWI